MTMLPMYHIGKISPIYRHYLLIKVATQCYIIVLHGMFGNTSCHFASYYLMQILCPVPQVLC